MKYFGTDGIRREADFFTQDFLYKVAKGIVNYGGDNIKVLLAGDTRESTEWILQDLAAAFETLGIEYASAGVLPTPGINHCFFAMGFDFAIDVTASHNPYTDNGLKIFERATGGKLSEAGCTAIEDAIDNEIVPSELATTSLREDLHDEAVEIYREHLLEYIGDCDLSGLHIGMDCANGATGVINKTVLEKLGAKVEVINIDTNYGRKINDNCGSLHIEVLSKFVVENGLDFGVAFDGDGDRSLFVDAKGELVDGDELVVIIATALKLNYIGVTVVANQGILNWAKEHNVKVETTPVGDHNIAVAMQELGVQVGGEQNGHVLLPHKTAGDGLCVANVIAKIVAESGKSLAKLAKAMTKYPQVVVNVPATAAEKEIFNTSEKVKQILADYDAKLAAVGGRVLVRPSGTENLLRVTMWGKDENEITNFANMLADELTACIKEA